MKSLVVGLLQVVVLGSQALAGPQLNEAGFSQCLEREIGPIDLGEVRRHHRLGEFDLFLVFLSVYPGVRWSGVTDFIQDRAHARWQTAFEERESQLADRLLWLAESSDAITPAHAFRQALDVCGGPSEVLCATLILHNSLRTLGRHQQAIHRESGRDFNPNWFKSAREDWLVRIPKIQNKLISLRGDGGGDRWGEWYHFFGIFSYSIHELALRRDLSRVEFVVRMNELLNPLLAGAPEDPKKAEIDRQSVGIGWRALSPHVVRYWDVNSAVDCDRRESYVNAGLTVTEGVTLR